jgi:hypothetical protein
MIKFGQFVLRVSSFSSNSLNTLIKMNKAWIRITAQRFGKVESRGKVLCEVGKHNFSELIKASTPHPPLESISDSNLIKWSYPPFGMNPKNLTVPVYELEGLEFSGYNISTNAISIQYIFSPSYLN